MIWLETNTSSSSSLSKEKERASEYYLINLAVHIRTSMNWNSTLSMRVRMCCSFERMDKQNSLFKIVYLDPDICSSSSLMLIKDNWYCDYLKTTNKKTKFFLSFFLPFLFVFVLAYLIIKIDWLNIIHLPDVATMMIIVVLLISVPLFMRVYVFFHSEIGHALCLITVFLFVLFYFIFLCQNVDCNY